MVNPGNVHGLLTEDTAALPASAMHRAYSQPDGAGSPTDLDKEGNMYATSGDKTYEHDADKVDVNVDKYDGTGLDGTMEDRARVQKVARTSSYLATFFLITTDVLGPAVAPWAMSILGFVPGALIFFFLGVIATYTGLILLNLFIKLDTPDRPIRTFADIAERIAAHWGPTVALGVRHTVSILQAIQLFMSASVLILGSAINLSLVIEFNLCFVSCLAIFGVVFNVGGLIKQFRHLGYFANLSVWLNLAICFMSLGIAQGTGVFDSNTGMLAVNAAGQTVTSSVATGSTQVMGNADFPTTVSAITNMIYAYGGATLYVELMSEMRNPREFWKSLFMAEFIIIGMYFLFGIYFYSEQGIYTNYVFQAGLVSKAARQAAYIIGLVTLVIAGVMYGNVGLKVLYYQLVVDVFKGPQLNTRRGTYMWLACSVVFWWVAFVVAGSVPNLSSIVGLVGSLCIVQFSYTLPPIMQFYYYWSQGTTLKEKLTDKWALKAFDMLIFLGSLVVTGIGMWASIIGMIDALDAGGINGFGCGNPQYPQGGNV